MDLRLTSALAFAAASGLAWTTVPVAVRLLGAFEELAFTMEVAYTFDPTAGLVSAVVGGGVGGWAAGAYFFDRHRDEWGHGVGAGLALTLICYAVATLVSVALGSLGANLDDLLYGLLSWPLAALFGSPLLVWALPFGGVAGYLVWRFTPASARAV